MKASKWLARWNYVFYITRNNWKNLWILAYIFINMQMFLCATDRAWSGNSGCLWPILQAEFRWHLTDSSKSAVFQLRQPTQTDIMSNYINEITWLEDSPTFPHSFWQQAETLIQCYLALPRNYTAHPVAFTIHVIRLRSLHFFQPISDRLYLCPPCRG